MKTKIYIIVLTFYVSALFAQTDSLTFQKDLETLKNKVILLEQNLSDLQNNEDIQVIKKELEILKAGLETLKSDNKKIFQEANLLKKSLTELKKDESKLKSRFYAYKKNVETKILSLQQAVDSNTASINKTEKVLGIKINETQKLADENFSKLDKTISQNTLYWIIAVLLVVILVALLFILLRKQLFKQKSDLISDIQKTRKTLEEEAIKLDNKLIETLESQLKIINSDKISKEEEPDHTFALKVADEIVRIEKNISKMDSSTKGIKPLIKGIERIKDNFKANGYEIVQLLGKEYDDNMNIDVINFIEDDAIPKGKRIITRIIKPQVNYKGVLIQRAQVDVSQN